MGLYFLVKTLKISCSSRSQSGKFTNTTGNLIIAFIVKLDPLILFRTIVNQNLRSVKIGLGLWFNFDDQIIIMTHYKSPFEIIFFQIESIIKI